MTLLMDAKSRTFVPHRDRKSGGTTLIDVLHIHLLELLRNNRKPNMKVYFLTNPYTVNAGIRCIYSPTPQGFTQDSKAGSIPSA